MNKNMLTGVVVGVFAAVLIHASGIVEASGQALKGYFTDRGWWSENAEWAKDNGLMSGLSDNRFGGDEPLTRGEMATLLRNLSERGLLGTASDKKTEPQFGTDFYQKQPMNLPLSKDQVKEIWGSKYAEVRDAAAGDLILWRYDIGAKDHYKFETDNDSIDIEGLKNKKVSGQLFITWNEQGELLDITYYFLKDGTVHEYKVAGELKKRQ